MAKLGVVVRISYGDFDIQQRTVVAAGPIPLAKSHAENLNARRTKKDLDAEVEYKVESVHNLEC